MLMNIWETAVINRHSLISLSVFPSLSVYCSLDQISLSVCVCCSISDLFLSISLFLLLAWSDLSLSVCLLLNPSDLSLYISHSVTHLIRSLCLLIDLLNLYLSHSHLSVACSVKSLFLKCYTVWSELELIGTWKNWSKSHWAFGFNLWFGGLCDVRVDRWSFGSCNMWADKQGEAAGVEQRPWPTTYTTTKKAREQIVRNQ